MEGTDPSRESWGKFSSKLGKKSVFAQGAACDGMHWKGVWELVKVEEKFCDFCALQILVCVSENLFSCGLCP